jgi:NTE family protein
MRLLYGLCGNEYYIDRTLSESDAYNLLCDIIRDPTDELSLRDLHDRLHKFAKDSGSKGDYYDVLISYMEQTAKKQKIDPLGICTDAGLLGKIQK